MHCLKKLQQTKQMTDEFQAHLHLKKSESILLRDLKMSHKTRLLVPVWKYGDGSQGNWTELTLGHFQMHV